VRTIGRNICDNDALFLRRRNVNDVEARRQHTDVAQIRAFIHRLAGNGRLIGEEFVMAQLLEICHRIGHHNDAVQQGRWTACRDFSFWDYPLMELAGKTFGIVGYGRIGQATAELARAFGMNVIYYSRHGSGEGYVPLDELYARSDIVSLHCPQTPENVGMIDKTALAKMKDGVILLNTARGGLINEADLRDALLSGKVYAAASDVVSTEPIRADNPLLGLDNIIITPHIAWASHEARQRLMDTAVENVRNFLNGTPSNNVAKVKNNPPERAKPAVPGAYFSLSIPQGNKRPPGL